jgi:polyferredoxin
MQKKPRQRCLRCGHRRDRHARQKDNTIKCGQCQRFCQDANGKFVHIPRAVLRAFRQRQIPADVMT